MKLKFICSSKGLSVFFLPSDKTSIIKKNSDSTSFDSERFFDDRKIRVTKYNGDNTEFFGVQSCYLQSPVSLIQGILNNKEKIHQPLGLEEESTKSLLNNPKLLEIESKVKQYSLLIKKIEDFHEQINEISKADSPLDYVPPDLNELIKKKTLLIEQLKLFQTELQTLAKEFPNEPQLVEDILSDVKKHQDDLAMHTHHTLSSLISKKNELMENSVNEEIKKLGASFLDLVQLQSSDKRLMLAKLKLINTLPQNITNEQKKALLTLEKDLLEIKVKHINDLTALGLLTNRALQQILGAVPLSDKSCDARLNTTYTFFNVDSKSQASRDFWTLCSNAIEENIVAKLEKKEPLHEILAYAATKRKAIAALRKESHEFGQIRTETVDVDQYSNNDLIVRSVIAPSSFVALANAISQQQLSHNNPKQLDLKSTLSFGNHHIHPPEGKLTLQYDAQHQLCAIFTEFQPPNTGNPNLNQALKAWQAHYLLNEKISPEELLQGIGQLAFMLSRYYSFDRGTGSTSQWIIRSLVQYAFGVDLKDISLGAPDSQPQNGAPFDVYSHVCVDADFYAKQFCKKVGALEFSTEYKQILTGKKLVHEILEAISRLEKEPKSAKKAETIKQALTRATEHFSTSTSYTIKDFLEYKEGKQKSLSETLKSKSNPFDFIHTPNSYKDINLKFKSLYKENIRCDTENFDFKMKQ